MSNVIVINHSTRAVTAAQTHALTAHYSLTTTYNSQLTAHGSLMLRCEGEIAGQQETATALIINVKLGQWNAKWRRLSSVGSSTDNYDRAGVSMISMMNFQH